MKVAHITKKMDPVLDVLKNSLFRHLWVGQIATQLASNMLIFLLALLIYRMTGSNVAVSGLFLAYGFPSLLFGVMAGTIVDRLDRRAVLIVAHVTRALLMFAVMAAGERISAVYLLVFTYALINQLTTPAEVPLIPQFVPKTHLVSANSLFSFTFYGSMAVGLIAAGPVLRFLGADGAHILIFILYMIGAISVMGIPPQGEGIKSLRRIFQYDLLYIAKRFLVNMEMGVKYVAKSATLREAVVLLTGTQIMLVLLGTLGPGFADKVLRIDIRDASLLIVGPTILGILSGALWVGNRGYRYSQNILMNIGVTAAGLILITTSAVFAATNTLWFTLVPRHVVNVLALGLFYLLGIANSLLDVPSNTMLQKEAEGDMRGRVYGILSASIGGAGILPVVVSGLLADLIGVGNVIFILGLIVLTYGVMRSIRSRKQGKVQ
ncbi:MFS transporter [Candidatus Gottesmanbacteria bacterium]|nr:MFS transporter [Candidatus Gottesmanbacteria bacterium]